MSPGPTRTDFGTDMTGLPSLFPRFMKMIPFLFGSPEKGAETVVELAESSSLRGVTGKFFLRGRERRTRKITYNNSVAARLWKASDDLCARFTADRPAVA
jgi:retinol dehydrogenase 14